MKFLNDAEITEEILDKIEYELLKELIENSNNQLIVELRTSYFKFTYELVMAFHRVLCDYALTQSGMTETIRDCYIFFRSKIVRTHLTEYHL